MDKGINLRTIGIPEIRHFLYKSKSNAQLLCSEISAPYHTAEEFTRLEALYYDIHHRIHNTNRPLKLIYQLQEKEIILAWVKILLICILILKSSHITLLFTVNQFFFHFNEKIRESIITRQCMMLFSGNYGL